MKRVLLCSLVVLTIGITSGCFLQTNLGVEFVDDNSTLVDQIFSAMDNRATLSICSPFFDHVECRYFVNGELIGSTAQFQSEFGIIGGAIVDPVVLELPSAVTNIAGTFEGGGVTGNLVVYPKLSFVPVDDSQTIAAEPGTQLVIVDLPDGTPVGGVDYHFNLSFHQTVPKGTGPTPVKALLTGKTQLLGKTFYMPFLPCTTSFSSVPAILMPRTGSLSPISIPNGLTGCSMRRYTYFRAPRTCDLDNDADVDNADINLIMNLRNTTAAPGDPRDINHDGLININDARACVVQCTRALCAM